MLLFAVGFALLGLSYLITTVHKVMTKSLPSQSIPPTAVPLPYAPPQPAYNWSLNGGRVQKLALGQGSGGGVELPPGRGQLPISGTEEGEAGFIPIACSTIPARIPVFEPEPVYRAERVYEDTAPLPNAAAVPVEGLAPEPSAIAVPAAYFREQPTVQDIPVQKMRETINRASHASSTAAPIPAEGEVRNLFGREHMEAIETTGILISNVEPAPPPEPLRFDAAEAASEPVTPPIVEKMFPEPPASVPEPQLAAIPEPDLVIAPESEPDQKPETFRCPDPLKEHTDKQRPSHEKARRRKRDRFRPKNTPPVSPGPPADRIVPEEKKKNPDSAEKPQEGEKEAKKPGLKERNERFLRELAGKLVEKVPEQIREAVRPVLFCICVAVCLFCISLFTYFDKHPYAGDPPLIVDIPQETRNAETPDETEPEPSPAEETAKYVMALIGEQEAVSTTAEGFEPSFEDVDYAGVPFYSLTFAIQLDSDPGEEFQRIQVFDAGTMEDLTATPASVLHVYTGEIPSDEYFLSHPVKSAPVVSSAVSDEIITCVFVSLEKRSIFDLKVILSQANTGSDALIEKEIMVNGRADDLRINTAYLMGSGLIKLGDQFYVSESGTGIGSVPGENKYVTRKIRCVSHPLTGSVSGLEASSIGLFNRQTGEGKELPEGMETYYRENYVENEALMEVAFGIQTSGGSYEEAVVFLDESLPGYIIDGQHILF